MTAYMQTAEQLRIILGIGITLITAGAWYLSVSVITLHMKRRFLWITGVTVGITTVVFQGMSDVEEFGIWGARPGLGTVVGAMPVLMIVVSEIVLTCGEIGLWRHLTMVRGGQLGPMSIKDHLDALPDGICYADDRGRPILVNCQMNLICAALFESEILNAEHFWKRIQDEQEIQNMSWVHVVRREPSLILKFADGGVWDFRRKQLQIEQKDVWELMAYDVREQYQLNQELHQKNDRLNQVNARLRRFNEEVEQVTREREILDAKIQVHDDVGRALLAMRTYLMYPKEERNRTRLLALWNYIVTSMKPDTVTGITESYRESQMSGYSDIHTLAEQMGVQIKMDGELPESVRERRIFRAIIRECLNNMVKHAGGDCLFVKIKERTELCRIEITNNGRQPDNEIRERGGLKNLRRMVETAGGTMQIKSTPQFVLQVEIIKGEREE